MSVFRSLFLGILLLSAFVSPVPATAAAEECAAPAAADLDLLPASNAAGLFGYVDAHTNAWAVPPRFADADLFVQGFAVVAQPPPGKGRAIIDRKGGVILEGPFSGIRLAGPGDNTGRSDGNKVYGRVYVVEEGRRRGVFHAEQGWLLPLSAASFLTFAEADTFFTPQALVLRGKQIPLPKGFSPKQIDFVTRSVLLSEGAATGRSTLYGLMGFDGNLIIPPTYHEIETVPGESLWLAMRISDKGVSAEVKQILSGGSEEKNRTLDYVSTDIFDAEGTILHSFTSHRNPDVRGTACFYTSKGQYCVTDLRSGDPLVHVMDNGFAGYVVFRKDERNGLLGPDGQTAVPAVYSRLFSLGGELFAACAEPRIPTGSNSCGVINVRNEPILPFIYDHIDLAGSGPDGESLLHVTRQSGGKTLHGVVGRDGREVLPVQYMTAVYFNAAGRALVVNGEWKHGLADNRGNLLLPCEYADIHDTAKDDVEEPYYIAQLGEKQGLFDKNGKPLLPVAYSHVYLTGSGRPFGWFTIQETRDSGLFGAVNIHSGIHIPAEYAGFVFQRGHVIARGASQERRYSRLLDDTGKVLGEYAVIRAPEESAPGVYVVSRDEETWGMIGSGGMIIVPTGAYSSIIPALSGLFRVQEAESGRIYYVNAEGRSFKGNAE